MRKLALARYERMGTKSSYAEGNQPPGRYEKSGSFRAASM
jgi:hypothetical protein